MWYSASFIASRVHNISEPMTNWIHHSTITDPVRRWKLVLQLLWHRSTLKKTDRQGNLIPKTEYGPARDSDLSRLLLTRTSFIFDRAKIRKTLNCVLLVRLFCISILYLPHPRISLYLQIPARHYHLQTIERASTSVSRSSIWPNGTT